MRDEAVDLLFKYLGSLPMKDGGELNLLPWTHESDETNLIKRTVCESIVSVLEGFFAAPVEGAPPRVATALCSSCGKELFRAAVSPDGVANVPGTYLLSTMHQLSIECPHDTVTLEDQRRKIEEALSD